MALTKSGAYKIDFGGGRSIYVIADDIPAAVEVCRRYFLDFYRCDEPPEIEFIQRIGDGVRQRGETDEP